MRNCLLQFMTFWCPRIDLEKLATMLYLHSQTPSLPKRMNDDLDYKFGHIKWKSKLMWLKICL